MYHYLLAVYRYLMFIPVFLTVVTFFNSGTKIFSHVHTGVIICLFLTVGQKCFKVGQKVSETFYPRDKKSLKLLARIKSL